MKRAMTATLGGVARPRGSLTRDQRARILNALDEADAADQRKHEVIVAVLREGASFAEVSKATGLSTNTLQRWKREAGK